MLHLPSRELKPQCCSSFGSYSVVLGTHGLHRVSRLCSDLVQKWSDFALSKALLCVFKNVVLNLKRPTLTDRGLYGKAIRDPPSKSVRKHISFYPSDQGRNAHLLSLGLLNISPTSLSSGVPVPYISLLELQGLFWPVLLFAAMGKIKSLLLLLLASPFWVFLLRLSRVQLCAACCCT